MRPTSPGVIAPASKRTVKSKRTDTAGETGSKPRAKAKATGFISPDHEREYLAFVEEHPDIEAVEFLMVDPNGVMRGNWVVPAC